MNLAELIPPPYRAHLRKVYHNLFDITPEDEDNQGGIQSGWYLHPKAYINRIRLQKYKNIHAGEQCFIIGNGPSLKQMDLRSLQNEITFGLNRIYLLFPKLQFTTTYYVAVNRLVIQQCADEIKSLPMTKFISWRARNFLGFQKDIYYVRDAYDGTEGFAKNPTWQIWEGATVTYVAMQLAYYMGFQKVILIGVDHSYETQGEPHQEVTSQAEDPNHFDPTYFGKGFRWQLPDLATSERSYLLARHYFEADNREILDATMGGKLNLFPKVDFNSLF